MLVTDQCHQCRCWLACLSSVGLSVLLSLASWRPPWPTTVVRPPRGMLNRRLHRLLVWGLIRRASWVVEWRVVVCHRLGREVWVVAGVRHCCLLRPLLLRLLLHGWLPVLTHIRRVLHESRPLLLRTC